MRGVLEALAEDLRIQGRLDVREALKYQNAAPLLKRSLEIAEAQGSSESTTLGRNKLNLAIIARDESDHVAA
jgi:hypothetical protein